MSLEELKKIDACDLPLGKLIAMISRGCTIYFNNRLEQYNINKTQMHILFEIHYQKEINQEQIASLCNMDKGSVTRSIRKLEDNGFIKREIDENNRRQNKISLTKKGEETFNKTLTILKESEKELFEENLLIENKLLHETLKQTAIRIMEINQKEKNK